MKWLLIGGGIVIVSALIFLGCLFNSDIIKDLDHYEAHKKMMREKKIS